jgi:hypothetical protein
MVGIGSPPEGLIGPGSGGGSGCVGSSGPGRGSGDGSGVGSIGSGAGVVMMVAYPQHTYRSGPRRRSCRLVVEPSRVEERPLLTGAGGPARWSRPRGG